MPNLDASSSTYRVKYFALIALLFILFAQLLTSAPLKSPTVDEPNHLTRGYVYLKTGKLRFTSTTGHPPLFNLISALPLSLLSEEIGMPQEYAGWEGGFVNAYAIEFIFNNPVSLERLFFLGRLPTMFITLCLAALVARWAGELYGGWGSVISLILCTLDPNIVAHGRLVTTDIGVTFFFVLTVYVFEHSLRDSFSLTSRTVLSLILTGVILGLAQCVKFSAILLLPILGLLGVLKLIRWKQKPLILGSAILAILLPAALTIWAVYRFEVRPPVGWKIPLPAPVHIEGFRASLTRVSSNRSTFLMGKRLSEGRWYYFIIAFILKTPLSSLLALLLALLSAFRQRITRHEMPLCITGAIYLIASMGNSLNLGYRHLLPMLPFLWIYVGRLGSIPRHTLPNGKYRWKHILAIILFGSLSLNALNIWPDYLAYFNALAGGPDGGWHYLVDSNLDWGQELYTLEEYINSLEQTGENPVHISWFGTTYPHLYDTNLTYQHLPGHFSYPYPNEVARSPYNPHNPEPGLYAISATNLQGSGLPFGDIFVSFRSQEPIARLGHSIFIYEVTASEESQKRAHPTCISGIELRDILKHPEVTEHTIARGTGRIKWFDQNSSFIIPEGEESAYALPVLPLDFAPDWQKVFQIQTTVVHTQTIENEQEFLIYNLDRTSADMFLEVIRSSLNPKLPEWSQNPAPRADTQGHALATPVSFEHGLDLLGYRLLTGNGKDRQQYRGEPLGLITIWQVTEEMEPTMGELKLFVHLLDSEGQMRSGDDRLGLEPLTWGPGDVLIQHHCLEVPPDAPPGEYQIGLGLYLPRTMQRLFIYDHEKDKLLTDQLLIRSVHVVD